MSGLEILIVAVVIYYLKLAIKELSNINFIIKINIYRLNKILISL